MWLSDRVQNIRPSGVRKIFDLARTVKDPVDLSLGEPDFDIPESIKEEGIRWIRKGFNKYTPSGGLPELREKILHYLHNKGIMCEDVIVTPGVTGGLLLSLLVTLNPGDEIIIPDPYFVLYEYQVLLLGGKPVFFDTYPDFTLREDDLRAAFSERTEGHPHQQPQQSHRSRQFGGGACHGGACGKGEERPRLLRRYLRPLRLRSTGAPDLPGQLYENTLTFGGFSKNWGMTGWRLGYVAGPKEIIDSMVTMQQYVFSSVNSIAQKAALLALDFDTKPLIETFVGKRDLIYDGLKDKFRLAKPLGAYYAFPEAPGGDGDAFVERAIKNRLFIIPGSVFSRKATHFRISFAAGEEAIVKGIEILNSMV